MLELRWRTGLAATTAAIVLAATGCASDETADPTPQQINAKADSVKPDASEALDTDPADGRLTTTSGAIITDYGDRDDSVAAVQALSRLQHNFRAGRMDAACARVSDSQLDQFVPRGTRRDTPCPRKLAIYAAQRDRRGQEPERLMLLWVRTYNIHSGIWVEDQHGKRRRISMTADDGVWRYNLGGMQRPDILAAELAGVDDYSKR